MMLELVIPIPIIMYFKAQGTLEEVTSTSVSMKCNTGIVFAFTIKLERILPMLYFTGTVLLRTTSGADISWKYVIISTRITNPDVLWL